MHFFNPVRRMTLVEVVRGPATSDATVAAVVAHAKRLGKCPVVVRDSPGFLVNRVLMPYLHEAVEMAREGVECGRIDRVARGFGMPMGPIELYDMIGLDTAFYAGLVLSAAYGDRIEASPVIPALVKSGRLGRKSGCGFYRYAAAASKPRMLGPDAGAAELIRRYALPAHETSDRTIAIAVAHAKRLGKCPIVVRDSPGFLVNRLLMPYLHESVEMLREGGDPKRIDRVARAFGMPMGPLELYDMIGLDTAFYAGLVLNDAYGDRIEASPVIPALVKSGRLGRKSGHGVYAY